VIESLRCKDTATRFELGDRILALLDHLFHDGRHVGIRQFDALVDFLALDFRQQQANRAQLARFLGAHGVFHVFGNLFFQAHGYPR